mmetsp:Transcript_24900/g.31862  ORF Transcript_24900/g.31862 Transcript_24900/m.31862 type:complete len:80 (-) Transcript_24900:1247-1486(-)
MGLALQPSVNNNSNVAIDSSFSIVYSMLSFCTCLGKFSLETLPFFHQMTQLLLTVDDDSSHFVRLQAYKFADLSYCQRS